MEKLITNLQQTYCTRNSYYMMSIINQFREKAPDLCINYSVSRLICLLGVWVSGFGFGFWVQDFSCFFSPMVFGGRPYKYYCNQKTRDTMYSLVFFAFGGLD